MISQNMQPTPMSVEAINRLFYDEFAPVRAKFETYALPLPQAEHSTDPHIWKPGVYVFWHPARGVIKVGRHFTNARKRAFEHLRDDVNTGGTMAGLRKIEETRLLLFNLKDTADIHWAAALEIFFERKLAPEIRSGRLG